MTTEVKKLSFAKVAASAKDTAPSRVPPPRTVAVASSKQGTAPQPSAGPPANSSSMGKGLDAKIAAGTGASAKAGDASVEQGEAQIDTKVVDGLHELKLDRAPRNLVVNGSASTTTTTTAERSSKTPSDNVSRADSSSELGTKPPSLSDNSINSSTTFALDEKESLRPDDSASMKAAAEDDDSFSVRGSYPAGSRVGSEVAARFRIQLGDMPPRTITTHRLLDSEGIATPQSGMSDKQPTADAQLLPLNDVVAGQEQLSGQQSLTDQESLVSGGFYSQHPDEKLLEAMRKPQDRLFLLRLEKQVIDFVQDSKEPFMDLPPSNSFFRLLTHKLADYYHMTHSCDSIPQSVRIYRTPFCRVPPSLASMVASTPDNDTPPPAVLPRKIMRRGEDGEIATSSAGPSKPTSEAGSDAKDKPAPAKEKLTREEREEAYNRARERIFGSNEKAETSTPENGENAGTSRASSVSAKDRSNVGKRGKTGRQRREDSESFDSRSAYAPVYGPQQQQTWFQPQYVPMVAGQYNDQYQQPYPNPVQPSFGSPVQAYPPPVMPNGGFMPAPYGNMQPQYAPQPQPAPQRYQPQPNPPMVSYSTTVQSIAVPTMPMQGMPVQNMPQQAWQPGSSPGSYQGSSPGSYPARSPGGPGIPYAYGQLPANANPHDPKSQHPIPGSYTRRQFNPKTQSFVPGGGMSPMQLSAPPPVPYNGASPHHSSPQMNPQHLAYPAYAPPMPQQHAGFVSSNGAGYGMARQGSNSSIPPYQPQPQFQAPLPQQYVPQAPASMPHMHAKAGLPHSQAPNQTYTNLPNYGNPATLPQKPPT